MQTQVSRGRILAASVIGNALEFYDFTLCGVFIAVISREFFTGSSLLGGFFAFSAAFWSRPLGAVLFGYLGDRFGRKPAMTVSVSLMSIPTLIIGFLPGYETIGMAAPVILIICRLLQGLCTGGEYNGAAVFALESLKVRPGLISGMISGSCVMGAITATMMAYLVSREGMPAYAWRIPFIFGGIIGFVGYYIRRYTDETLPETARRNKIPLVTILKSHKASFLTVVLSGAFNGILSYTLFGFLNIYLSRYVHLTLSNSLFYNLFGLGAFMTLCPMFGRFADTIGVRKSMYLAGAIGLTVPWIVFSLLPMTGMAALVTGQLLLGMTVASFVGPSHYFHQSLFPMHVRYSGIAGGFSLGMAITGGTTPLILTGILDRTGLLIAPAFYVAAAALAWIIGLSAYVMYAGRYASLSGEGGCGHSGACGITGNGRARVGGRGR